MTENESIVLDVWKGDWKLPSVNTECLQILAYARFCKVPVKINIVSNPFQTPHGRLPLLKCGNIILTDVKDIILFFKKRNYNPDSILNSKQFTEIIAYDNMLKDKLYPALEYIWWIDQKNLNDVIRPWYCSEIPFPLNFYYPRKFESEAKSLMEILYPMEDNAAVIENSVYYKAKACLTLLSTKLNENDYFFGSQPTSLDAIVYSYLAPLLEIPLPNRALQNHLKTYTNLEKFVSRISIKYFREEYQAYRRDLDAKNEKALNTIITNERRTQVLAGLFATCAMVGYALLNGIIKMPQDNAMLYDNGYDDNTVKYILDDEEADDN